jgi:hypothetical protein
MNNLVLDTLFHTRDKKELLFSQLGFSVHHFKGKRNQYTRLLPWTIINDILMKHRLTPPRTRLVYAGGNVPVDDYTFLRRERSGRLHRLLDLVAISQQLRRGATLIIDSIDELYDPIRDLSFEMEHMFHEEIQINAYIAWGDIPGFSMHEDQHDVIVFQVTGRKKWRILVPNYRVSAELEEWMVAGTRVAKDIWEFILEQGDALYIPKGWQHEVVPLGEETVHLTAGVERRIGKDYLSWILKNSEYLTILQEPAPRFLGEIARKEYQKKLKEEMMRSIDSLPLDRYFEACNTSLRVRSQINLPWSASNVFSIDSDTMINWLLPFIAIREKETEKNIYLVEAGGRILEISASTLLIIKHLEIVCHISYWQLCSFAGDYKITESKVAEIIDRLSLFGWVSITGHVS